jgi:hypothetical protein
MSRLRTADLLARLALVEERLEAIEERLAPCDDDDDRTAPTPVVRGTYGAGGAADVSL